MCGIQALGEFSDIRGPMWVGNVGRQQVKHETFITRSQKPNLLVIRFIEI